MFKEIRLSFQDLGFQAYLPTLITPKNKILGDEAWATIKSINSLKTTAPPSPRPTSLHSRLFRVRIYDTLVFSYDSYFVAGV